MAFKAAVMVLGCAIAPLKIEHGGGGVTYMTGSSESELGLHTLRTSGCVGENVTKDGICETAQRHSNE